MGDYCGRTSTLLMTLPGRSLHFSSLDGTAGCPWRLLYCQQNRYKFSWSRTIVKNLCSLYLQPGSLPWKVSDQVQDPIWLQDNTREVSYRRLGTNLLPKWRNWEAAEVVETTAWSLMDHFRQWPISLLGKCTSLEMTWSRCIRIVWSPVPKVSWQDLLVQKQAEKSGAPSKMGGESFGRDTNAGQKYWWT